MEILRVWLALADGHRQPEGRDQVQGRALAKASGSAGVLREAAMVGGG